MRHCVRSIALPEKSSVRMAPHVTLRMPLTKGGGSSCRGVGMGVARGGSHISLGDPDGSGHAQTHGVAVAHAHGHARGVVDAGQPELPGALHAVPRSATKKTVRADDAYDICSLSTECHYSVPLMWGVSMYDSTIKIRFLQES